MDYFAWDYTTWLNFFFLPLGAFLWWMGSRLPEVGGGASAGGGQG